MLDTEIIKDLVNQGNEEESTEIPSAFLANLIEWMRNNRISDEDITDCLLYCCHNQQD